MDLSLTFTSWITRNTLIKTIKDYSSKTICVNLKIKDSQYHLQIEDTENPLNSNYSLRHKLKLMNSEKE